MYHKLNIWTTFYSPSVSAWSVFKAAAQVGILALKISILSTASISWAQPELISMPIVAAVPMPKPAGQASGVSLDQVVQSISHDLHAKGEMTVPVVVTGHNLPDSNGSATWDVAAGVCNLQIRHTALTGQSAALSHPLWGRFLGFHELAHCDLFADPRGMLTTGASLGQPAQDMVDDFFVLQAVAIDSSSFEESRASPLMVLHEAYADAMALMRLRREGVAKEDLAFARKLRADEAFDPSHDTVKVFDEVMKLSENWIDRASVGQLQQASKRIALGHYAMSITTKGRSGDGSSVLIGHRMMSTLQSVHATLLQGPLRLLPFYENAETAPASALAHYPVLQWLSRQEGSMASHTGYEGFTQAWIQARYGLSQDRFLEEAELVSKHIEQDAGAPRAIGAELLAEAISPQGITH